MSRHLRKGREARKVRRLGAITRAIKFHDNLVTNHSKNVEFHRQQLKRGEITKEELNRRLANLNPVPTTQDFKRKTGVELSEARNIVSRDSFSVMV